MTEEQTASLLANQPQQTTAQLVTAVTQIRARFDTLRHEAERQAQEAKQLLADLMQFEIQDARDLHLVASVTQKASTTWKKLDEQRKEYLKPLADFIKTVNALHKIPVDTSKEIECTGKAKMEEALVTRKQSQDDIFAAMEMEPVNKDQLMARARELEWAIPDQIQLRDELVVEVDNKELLPLDYLDPNMARLRKAAREGKDIPGARYWKRDKVVVYREGGEDE